MQRVVEVEQDGIDLSHQRKRTRNERSANGPRSKTRSSSTIAAAPATGAAVLATYALPPAEDHHVGILPKPDRWGGFRASERRCEPDLLRLQIQDHVAGLQIDGQRHVLVRDQPLAADLTQANGPA